MTGYFVSFAIVTQTKDEKDQVLDAVRELIDTWPVEHRDWNVAVTHQDQPNKIPLHHDGIIRKFSAGEETFLSAHDRAIERALIERISADLEAQIARWEGWGKYQGIYKDALKIVQAYLPAAEEREIEGAR